MMADPLGRRSLRDSPRAGPYRVDRDAGDTGNGKWWGLEFNRERWDDPSKLRARSQHSGEKKRGGEKQEPMGDRRSRETEEHSVDWLWHEKRREESCWR